MGGMDLHASICCLLPLIVRAYIRCAKTRLQIETLYLLCSMRLKRIIFILFYMSTGNIVSCLSMSYAFMCVYLTLRAYAFMFVYLALHLST